MVSARFYLVTITDATLVWNSVTALTTKETKVKSKEKKKGLVSFPKDLNGYLLQT